MKRPRWTRPYWIIDHFPASRDRRLRWLRSYIDKHYSKKLLEAKKASVSLDRLSSIQDEFHMELSIIDEEVYHRISNQLLEKAFWLRVQVPPVWDQETAHESDDWTKTPFSDTYVLSEAGTAKVRELVRVEEKWRQERRAHWVAYIAAATGLIGALSGLVAVLQKGHGG
ncbi:hypothetical protein PQQ59_18455 [Paraburkholderia aspalathi]|uniref:hypothetical protein n=1 Tax=Paraburkholderia aspalathi TaxID=1324617 RepID=UPI001B1DAFC7|nr:hypothetical protein [Paraburkholderia aspalathi]CAE6708389.1 hypothetical protein R75465_00767 [Paraburkholderia aspalathi]